MYVLKIIQEGLMEDFFFFFFYPNELPSLNKEFIYLLIYLLFH